ncbi:MAG TPA: hypothetical protein P5567_00340 [Kiritimatiellia bacterium]|nr:hypothetical protein [Kiritimatiellia bacterium]HRZ10882.1 hypothetical protein [Kiritimatiellia bacterium]HSA18845.1 hypothetical protein [Kiritimatiellia bacterium]
MDKHRRVAPRRLRVESLAPPFSCFTQVEESFGGNPAVHRCFSLARSFKALTLVTEEIDAEGLLADENAEIAGLYNTFQPGPIVRISFWLDTVQPKQDSADLPADRLVGYAILKKDILSSTKLDHEGWHVFEAVFRKYDHRHNCVPAQCSYSLRVGATELQLPGVLYAQQNGLNKACAHVALRSLLSRFSPGNDLRNSDINKIARALGPSTTPPEKGLSAQQIQAVLKHYGVNYRDVDYEVAQKKNPTVRKTQPYQKYLYSAIESGCGGLLGFSMSGPKADPADPDKHIIPFFGHTFNKDTWAPDADQAYFNIGGGIGFIPSENWTSSFIGHDDNFGPNFCIPRLYVNPGQVDYVAEILPQGTAYSGMIAEALALQFIYSLHPYLIKSNAWSRRLSELAHPSMQRVILRAICVSSSTYVEHLGTISDWDGCRETPALVSELSNLLPKRVWVVEISIPPLFAAEERKVGEILLDATKAPKQKGKMAHKIDFGLFLLARLPTQYFVLKAETATGPVFSRIQSALESHVPVLEIQ